MIIIGGLLLGAAIIAGTAILNGWVLSVLWGWFMVPVFNLPILSIAPAIGIALVIGYLTKNGNCHGEDTRTTAEKLGEVFGGPLIALLFGWIIKGFM